MDNKKSFEFNFFYLINKSILLFKYIDINHQKEILDNIKSFINKLQEIFSNADFKNNIEKKNKILEILIQYFEQLIHTKIYSLINNKNKNIIINEIDKIALLACENNDKKSGAFHFAEKILENSISPNIINNSSIQKINIQNLLLNT